MARLIHNPLLPLLLGLALLPGIAPAPEQEGDDEPTGGIPTPEEVQRKLEEDLTNKLRAERNAHFRLCDEDRNGWISWREAEYALLMDREEYRLYDANGDGRISSREFADRYDKILSQIGGLPVLREELQARLAEGMGPALTPIGEDGAAAAFPNPADLLITYDRNDDDGLGQSELATMLRSLGLDLRPDAVLLSLDTNHTALLELRELVPLAEDLARRLAPPDRDREAQDRAAVFRRLYSDSRPRLVPDGSLPRPPLIPGPVSHFRRLDLDDDGFISLEDLRDLLAPARVNVRPELVLGALDGDGDGRLDETEFARSIGAR